MSELLIPSSFEEAFNAPDIASLPPVSPKRQFIFNWLHMENDPAKAAAKTFPNNRMFAQFVVDNWIYDEGILALKFQLREYYHKKYGVDYFLPSKDALIQQLDQDAKESRNATDRLKANIEIGKLRNFYPVAEAVVKDDGFTNPFAMIGNDPPPPRIDKGKK